MSEITNIISLFRNQIVLLARTFSRKEIDEKDLSFKLESFSKKTVDNLYNNIISATSTYNNYSPVDDYLKNYFIAK